jgi:hypothetical protein
MCRTTLSVSIRIAALVVVTLKLSAQPDDVRGRMADVLRYTGIENPAPDEVARMADVWTRAQQPGLGRDERRLAFRDMYLLYNPAFDALRFAVKPSEAPHEE